MASGQDFSKNNRQKQCLKIIKLASYFKFTFYSNKYNYCKQNQINDIMKEIFNLL